MTRASQTENCLSSEGPTTDTAKLDRHLLRGIAWTAAAKWITQLFTGGSMIAVARLLSPSDFGLVGMATLYLGLIQTFSEFGFGSAIVMLRDLSREQIAQLNAVAVISGAAGVCLSCALALPLGNFFHAPKLPAVVAAMSIGFLIVAFKTVPGALLQRRCGLRRCPRPTPCRPSRRRPSPYCWPISGSATGPGAGQYPRRACRHGNLHRLSPPRLPHAEAFLYFDLQSATAGISLVARFCWYGYSNADFLVAGRVLGPAAGRLHLGLEPGQHPGKKVTSMVGQVTPSFFSAVQNDSSLLRRYLRTLTEGIALVTFPAAFGLALLAPDLVHVVLGRTGTRRFLSYSCLRFIPRCDP